MEIHYFTKYSRKGASSRLRSYQYFTYFEKNDFNIKVYPLFDDNYLENLYQGKKSITKIFSAYLSRCWLLRKISKADFIVIEKELFPYFPSWIEQFLKLCGIKYIVDYDDAIFHNYDLSSNKWVRRLLSKKIDRVMAASNTVIAGNKYLKHRAMKARAKNIEIIPTVIEAHRYQKKEFYNSKQPIVIGWIGSPSTLKYLNPLIGVFKSLSENYPIHIHIIGAASFQLDLPTSMVNYIDWKEETEALQIAKFDIGIMPLDDTPWAKGKCAYKLIQYMACGLPIIASPVGMNQEVICNGKNGFLATTHEEWYKALEKYILDCDLRNQHGQEGYEIVQEKFTVKSQLHKWFNVFLNAYN